MSSFLNYFISNPFNTQIGQLIEKSTDGTQVSEDWAAYMQICDLINSTEDGPKDASRAIRKQLFNCAGKNTASILFTLTVLETCVKNCGRSFHLVIAQKDFLQDLVKILSMKPPLPQIANDKILGLLQMWEEAFKGIPELQEVSLVCNELREKKFDFPMLDMTQFAPINTPNKRKFEKTEVPIALDSHVPANPPSPIVQQDCNGLATLDALKVAKLRSELDIVIRNCSVFNEMLSKCLPATESQEDLDLMQELKETCLEMRKRIVELIDRIQFEQLTSEMIPVCDEVNNVLLRYERFERIRKNVYSDLTESTIESKSSNSAILPEFNSEEEIPNVFNPFTQLPNTNIHNKEYKEVEMGAFTQNNQKNSAVINSYTNQELLSDINTNNSLKKNDLTSSSDFDRFLESKSNVSIRNITNNIPRITSVNSHENGTITDENSITNMALNININGDMLNERDRPKDEEQLFNL